MFCEPENLHNNKRYLELSIGGPTVDSILENGGMVLQQKMVNKLLPVQIYSVALSLFIGD